MAIDDERTPPAKIRITRLQEAQLLDLVRIDRAAAELHQEADVDESLFVARTDVQIASLHRSHDVYVAEADHEVAGYLAWRDEPPKIGVVAILNVSPRYQRFAVASRLLRELGERCEAAGVQQVVARCAAKAAWARRFLEAMGFTPLGDALPAPLAEWRAQHRAAGDLVQEGEMAFWRPSDNLGVKILPGVPLPK
jgi:N-acetylglutamate synthase-like GNAT family acetyltransferase